ncbi:MAG TPA: hypothetical protein VLM11_06505 [Streptosporangiaceae bacterium]|nr:hypothetical protein [Streptosporangiaceae bacterium]
MPSTLAAAAADAGAAAIAPSTLAKAPPEPEKRSKPASTGRPRTTSAPTPAEFAGASPEVSRKSGEGSPVVGTAGPDTEQAPTTPDDQGVDTDVLDKVVSGGGRGADAGTGDGPDVELSETEVAEVLSGRIIPIGSFFGGPQLPPASTANVRADAPGETFLADIGRIAASWAQDRHLGITSAAGIGIALAVCSAAWFSAGTRADIIRGVAALWTGYLVLRAGQWLVREADQVEASQQEVAHPDTEAPAVEGTGAATRVSTRGRAVPGGGMRRGSMIAAMRRAGPVAWLAALGGALAECCVYAGLAAGAVAERWGAVWTLATAVLSLVIVRNLMTACSTPPGLSEQSGGTLRRLIAAVLTMPVGGRVLLVGIVAPVWGARTALLALLDWAIVSVGYGIAGRAAAGVTSWAMHGGQPNQIAARSKLVRLRDDGALARALGILVHGNLMPLPPALLGLAAVAALAFVGLHGLPGVLLIAPAVVMLLAAPGSAHPHTGRFDWLVPVLLLGAQCLYLTATGLAAHVPGAVIFALIAAIMLRYTDLAWPGRPVQMAKRRDPDTKPVERGTALGWEGRMLFAGLSGAMGVATFAYIALTAYLAVLICMKAVTSCLAPDAASRS